MNGACHIRINPRLPEWFHVRSGRVPAAKGSGRMGARSLEKIPDTAFRPLRSPVGPQAAFLNAGVSASITVSFGVRTSAARVSAGFR